MRATAQSVRWWISRIPPCGEARSGSRNPRWNRFIRRFGPSNRVSAHLETGNQIDTIPVDNTLVVWNCPRAAKQRIYFAKRLMDERRRIYTRTDERDCAVIRICDESGEHRRRKVKDGRGRIMEQIRTKLVPPTLSKAIRGSRARRPWLAAPDPWAPRRHALKHGIST